MLQQPHRPRHLRSPPHRRALPAYFGHRLVRYAAGLRLNETHRGGLGSYPLANMVKHVLPSSPPRRHAHAAALTHAHAAATSTTARDLGGQPLRFIGGLGALVPLMTLLMPWAASCCVRSRPTLPRLSHDPSRYELDLSSTVVRAERYDSIAPAPGG